MSRNDNLHGRAIAFTEQLAQRRATVVTSSLVMVEVLNRFAGTSLRAAAAKLASSIRAQPDLIYIDADGAHYVKALGKYTRYRDKKWSLTDCSSMILMEDFAITETLTSDHDFEQAGYVALMRHASWP